MTDATALAEIPRDHIIHIGRSKTTRSGIRRWTNLCLTSTSVSSSVELDPKNDLAFLVYSSGTTGLPKTVMLTQFNVNANVQQVEPSDTISWERSTRVVSYRRLRGGLKFIDAVPKSGSGKTLRRLLKDLILEETRERVQSGKARL